MFHNKTFAEFKLRKDEYLVRLERIGDNLKVIDGNTGLSFRRTLPDGHSWQLLWETMMQYQNGLITNFEFLTYLDKLDKPD